MYAGVQFRSRLEARWAAFFDLLGWKWEYEPFDLQGYIPDFLLHVPKYAGVCWLTTDTLLVEVKPTDSYRYGRFGDPEPPKLTYEKAIAVGIGGIAFLGLTKKQNRAKNTPLLLPDSWVREEHENGWGRVDWTGQADPGYDFRWPQHDDEYFQEAAWKLASNKVQYKGGQAR